MLKYLYCIIFGMGYTNAIMESSFKDFLYCFHFSFLFFFVLNKIILKNLAMNFKKIQPSIDYDSIKVIIAEAEVALFFF